MPDGSSWVSYKFSNETSCLPVYPHPKSNVYTARTQLEDLMDTTTAELCQKKETAVDKRRRNVKFEEHKYIATFFFKAHSHAILKHFKISFSNTQYLVSLVLTALSDEVYKLTYMGKKKDYFYSFFLFVYYTYCLHGKTFIAAERTNGVIIF